MANRRAAELTAEQRALVDEAIQAAAPHPPAEQMRIAEVRARGDEAVYREVMSILYAMGDIHDDQCFDDPLQAAADAGAETDCEEHTTSDQRTDAVDKVSARLAHPGEWQDFSVGSKIGPYKLVDKLGEGGFGTVYLAEQTGPLRRRVALKVIKPGIDTRAVIARFEQERQALAIMDHPGIAKVFTSGATEMGRPYFVMEHIPGDPITHHCDKHCLTIDERIGLFIEVCDAVNHAHEKGVVHRDLKPSNVLVAYQGGRPVAKIIDFGIAKALCQPLMESPDQTMLGQAIGTPEYMSPEQAEMGRQSIDHRSDIYSLGAMLYELLCGIPPFDARKLREGGLEGMREMLRTVSPPPPSERLKQLPGTDDSKWRTSRAVGEDPENSELATIARNRSFAPRRLIKLLRGELDAIVMKCMEKRRERRYSHANDLARELQMYLEGRTLEHVGGQGRWRSAPAWGGWKPIAVGGAAITAFFAGVVWLWSGGIESSQVTAGAEATHSVDPAQPRDSPDLPTVRVRALLPLKTITVESSSAAGPVVISGWVVNDDELKWINRRIASVESHVVVEVRVDAAEVRRHLRRAFEEAGAVGLRITDRRRPDWGPHYVQVWFTPTDQFDLDAARELGRSYVLDDANLVITAMQN